MKNILFLCTGNSCRSVLAEAYLNHAAGKCEDGGWTAHSAGSDPTGKVHPMAIETLAALGIEAGYARSKSWDVFAGEAAPHMDVIVTVCDDAAGETCPIWPGHPSTLHWPFPDPAMFSGSDEETRAHFRDVFAMIKNQLDGFLAASAS
ncbi:MAG: arsenate reductase ArsC [Alphaproteobacteria bacterium]|nr:arsenate reductase ArsC [Alphaproteobacteria bacterium]